MIDKSTLQIQEKQIENDNQKQEVVKCTKPTIKTFIPQSSIIQFDLPQILTFQFTHWLEERENEWRIVFRPYSNEMKCLGQDFYLETYEMLISKLEDEVILRDLKSGDLLLHTSSNIFQHLMTHYFENFESFEHTFMWTRDLKFHSTSKLLEKSLLSVQFHRLPITFDVFPRSQHNGSYKLSVVCRELGDFEIKLEKKLNEIPNLCHEGLLLLENKVGSLKFLSSRFVHLSEGEEVCLD